jgi:hypothetical protein
MPRNPNLWTIKRDYQNPSPELCEEILVKAATAYRSERRSKPEPVIVPANRNPAVVKTISKPLVIHSKPPRATTTPKPGVKTPLKSKIKPVPELRDDHQKVARELLEMHYRNIEDPTAFGQVDQLIKDGQLELAKKSITWHERNNNEQTN